MGAPGVLALVLSSALLAASASRGATLAANLPGQRPPSPRWADPGLRGGGKAEDVTAWGIGVRRTLDAPRSVRGGWPVAQLRGGGGAGGSEGGWRGASAREIPQGGGDVGPETGPDAELGGAGENPDAADPERSRKLVEELLNLNTDGVLEEGEAGLRDIEDLEREMEECERMMEEPTEGLNMTMEEARALPDKFAEKLGELEEVFSHFEVLDRETLNEEQKENYDKAMAMTEDANDRLEKDLADPDGSRTREEQEVLQAYEELKRQTEADAEELKAALEGMGHATLDSLGDAMEAGKVDPFGPEVQRVEKVLHSGGGMGDEGMKDVTPPGAGA